MIKPFTGLLISAPFVLVLLGAHPVRNYTPLEGNVVHSSRAASHFVLGDLKFGDDLNSVKDLTAEEEYMLWGALDGPTGDLKAWWEEVMMVAVSYERKTGQWPTAITDEVLDTVLGDKEPGGLLRELVKSPITGRYPRLDSASFSAGDFYMRRLTAEENTSLDQQGQGMSVRNPAARKATRKVLLGNPIYIRMYGSSKVLMGDIVQMSITPPSMN